MSIIGKWKPVKIKDFSSEGEYVTPDVLKEKGLFDSDMEQMMSSVIEIKDDGIIEQYIVVPTDMIDEARAEGAPVDEQGRIKAAEATWKEVNGKYICNLDGQEFPMELTEEGYLPFMLGMILIEKI